MLDNELKNYFDSIEPDNELIERMIAMSNESNNEKKIKFSKKIIAVIAAVICIIGATTATAAILRINNDDNGIVNIVDTDNSFILDFTKAKRASEKLSNTDNELVKAIQAEGFKDVIIPSALITDGYRIDSTIPFLPQYTSAMFNFSNAESESISLTIIQDISDEDATDFWGTGDKNSTGEVVDVNGMDVVVVYMGDEEIGFVSYIFYANGNTIYQYSFPGGLDQTTAKEKTLEFVNSLAKQ